MEKYKEKLLNKLKIHIEFIRRKIQEKLEAVKTTAEQSLKDLGKMSPEDRAVFMNLRGSAQKRLAELGCLESSPYFMKCEIIDEKGAEKEYFFAKHEFSEQAIYSWVAAVAAIRFENPGKAQYKLPDGTIKTLTIKQKETYMIVDGKALLFTLETKDKPRELIYQEHFTKQKSVFALPEIVAQMEKTQDQVIRAGYHGPLVISGPAGSGKTTLALHRAAYLTQVPDTALLYPPESIIIFAQDNGAKNYFGTLLPSLGIREVEITTFSEWAFKILGIDGFFYAERYGENEKDLYEYQKLQALQGSYPPVWSKNIFSVLSLRYSKYFSPENLKLFNAQKNRKQLDRFDLTVLLESYFEKYKKFEIKREYQTFVKNKLVRKIEKKQAVYSLMIIDEFQNYLPEQLRILKSCLNEKTKSVVYVGDMAQQVKLGTIKNWEDIKEVISIDRNIKLNKVYRNTKNILSFIKSLGYAIHLPDGLKEGPIVVEKIVNTIEEEIKHIKKIIQKYEKGNVGIISKNERYLLDFKKEFAHMKNVRVFSMIESQGVEFDFVCLVGIKKELFGVAHSADLSPAHIEEIKRTQRDLLYVALTRAITELHILGNEKLGNITGI